MMNVIEAIILGLIQGFTEFLPVSSSGHLQIGAALLGTNPDENLTFAVAVHAATVLSTLVVLRKEVAVLFRGLFSFKWNEETQYVAKIAVSMIPVGIIGVFFKDYVEQIFGSSMALVGACLLLTATLLLFSYYKKPKVQNKKIGFMDALIIGIGQACAVLPGLSRSGTTIATGLLLGNKKEDVAKFSFLMVIIPVLGEATLDLLKGGFTDGSGIAPGVLLAGFVAAFLAGALACRLMINIVKKGKLIYFAYYCIAASALAFGIYLFQ